MTRYINFNNFLRKIKIPRDKDAKSLKSRDVVLYE